MKLFFLAGIAALVLTGCTPEYTDPNLPRATKGGASAVVVIEEYGDFQCPACGQAWGVVKSLQEEFGDSVQWKYNHFPLSSIHPYAFNAAMASECAHDQGKFWEYHDILFQNQHALERSKLFDYASELGLDRPLFDACLKSRSKSKLVQNDFAIGESRGVNSTPTFFVNGTLISNWSELRTIIESALRPAVPGA